MARHLRIAVSDQPDTAADVSIGHKRLRERFMRWIFGPLRDVTLVVPGRQIDGIAVTRTSGPKHLACPGVEEVSDEELMALADCLAHHPANGGDETGEAA